MYAVSPGRIHSKAWGEVLGACLRPAVYLCLWLCCAEWAGVILSLLGAIGGRFDHSISAVHFLHKLGTTRERELRDVSEPGTLGKPVTKRSLSEPQSQPTLEMPQVSECPAMRGRCSGALQARPPLSSPATRKTCSPICAEAPCTPNGARLFPSFPVPLPSSAPTGMESVGVY